ncbi:MAG: response regulator [Candidatus Omnitrophica bacterium]|nr:response regulator [Candidatus Omnitrophota bacterium]
MHILIAEKDALIRSLVTTRLRARHYQVTECMRSEEVLPCLDRQPVDLILLSSEMERIGGKFLVQTIRAKSHFAAIPIILMTEEDKIAQLLMVRERGFDDFLIKPFSVLMLQLRVEINIARTREHLGINPLTHLPGNLAIEKTIIKKIENGEKYSVLYVDINQFKSFNDLYGFEKGDNVLKQTSNILTRTADKMAAEGGCFVGHIGGDDFVVVLHPDHEEIFARAFIREFDRIMPTYYNEAEQKRGFVRVKNRRGKRENTPLMSCSVAACNNLYRAYKNLGEIAQDAAEVKAFLKSQTGSHYLRDRRHEPIRHLEKAVEILAPDVEKNKSAAELEPLGQILLDAGLIDQASLSLALKKHLETSERLGQILIRMNLIRSEDVGKMLQKKLNIPYASLRQFSGTREMLRLFTLDFIKSHRVVPLEATGQGIRLAMCDPFDLRTVDTIERITGLKPIPCLALEDEFEEFIEKRSQDLTREEKIG